MYVIMDEDEDDFEVWWTRSAREFCEHYRGK